MGDAPLELRKPGGMLVYGLPAASTLFMLRMLWATKRDAVPSDHSYWAMHTPIVLMPLAAAVLAGGIALAWRYERPEWVMGGVLVPALLLDLAGVGEWAPIMPMIAYWALIMTVAGDLRVLCFGLVSCMVLDSQAFAGNAWRQAGWSIWLDVTQELVKLFVYGTCFLLYDSMRSGYAAASWARACFQLVVTLPSMSRHSPLWRLPLSAFSRCLARLSSMSQIASHRSLTAAWSLGNWLRLRLTFLSW